MSNVNSNKEQMASFLLEELKSNWNYILHIEEVRFKHTKIYLIIIGAIIGLSTYFINLRNSILSNEFDLISAIIELKEYIIPGAFFIFIYGFFLCIFFASQKQGYEHYRIVNSQIRSWFVENFNETNNISFEKNNDPERNLKTTILSTFFYWYILIVFINVLAVWILCITTIDIIFSSAITFIVFLVECSIYYIFNVEIKPEHQP